MELEQQPPSKLREHFEGVGIEVNEGEVAGHMDLKESLNLNAVAIGLGLQNVEYDPHTFPGLIYQPNNQEVTAILYASGLVATVDGPSKDSIQDCYDTIIHQLSEIGLLEDTAGRKVTIPAETVPTPLIVNSEGEMSEPSGDQSHEEGIDQTADESMSGPGEVDESTDDEIRDEVREKFEYTSDK